MVKRITATLFAFILLFSSLPATALATDEKVYQLGETIWVVGATTTPTEKTEEGTMWDRVYTIDGDPVSEAGECPLELHKHVPSCYDTSGAEICGKTAHPRHTIACGIKNARYKWHVVEDPDYEKDDTGASDPSEPTEDTGPGYSDPDATYPEGSASFTVKNIDPEGTPLQDVEYYLLNRNKEVMGNFLTNEDGEIFFGGLQLRSGVDAEVWELTQNPPLPEELSDYYEENRDKWNVTIVRNADGESFSVSNVTLAEGDDATGEGEEDAYTQGYDSSTGTLTIINQFKFYSLMFTLKPILVTEEGEEEFSIPQNEDFAVHVTVSDENGNELPVTLPDGLSPQAYVEGLKAGTYTVKSIQSENAEMMGYIVSQPYAYVALPKPNEEAERPILQQNYITLGSEYSHPDFWIYLPYKLPSSLTVRVVNELDIQVKGSTIALMDGENIVQELNDENGYEIDLKDYAVEGKTLQYSLKQIKAPDGHNIAEEEYTVSVSIDPKDGKPQVSLKREQSLVETIASFFNGERATIDAETGNQLATFTNVRKTTKVLVASNSTVSFGEGAWQDEQILETIRKEKNSVFLNWTDINGETGSEEMSLVVGGIESFEAEIPYGASYAVEGVDNYGFAPAFSGKSKGTINADDVEQESPVAIGADWNYTVEPGEAQTMKLVLVDAEDTTKPLAGVPFELRMDGVEETDVYGTDNTGAIRIRVSRPCSFTLEQMEAAEGYVKLETPVQVDVGVDLAAKEGSDKPALVQNLAPSVVHEAVQLRSDGSWLIKNAPVELGEDIVDDGSNKMMINVVSESGSPVEGTQITMTCPDGSKKVLGNGDVINVEELGMVGTYSLAQTKSIAGHSIATENYKVTVSQKNGLYSVKVENTNQGLLDKIFGKNEIPRGSEGEWMLTFVNVRQTAKLELTCEVVVNFTGGSWQDLEFEKKYKEETEYEFLLSWDDGYQREQESATLVHGELHNFALEIPYGVEYKIECVNEKGYFDTTFTGAKTTIIGDSQLKEQENRITARNTYTIEPNPDADPVEVHLVKVDATTKEPLEGVEFELLDSDDRKLAGYTTGEDGKVDIVNTLKTGGTYGLKETKALSGYEKPSAAFDIEVEAKYKLFTATGKPVLKQSFEASLSHKTIEKQEDGSYMIKNYKEGQAPKGAYSGNPKTGDRFDMIVWGGVMLLSAAGIALLSAEAAKRKRKGF